MIIVWVFFLYVLILNFKIDTNYGTSLWNYFFYFYATLASVRAFS